VTAQAEPCPSAAASTLRAPVRLLHRLSRWLLAISLATVMIFTVAQVLDRYIFKSAFNAHDQFARMSLVLLTFVGVAVGIRDRANVRIEVLGHFAGARIQRIAALLLDAVILALAIAIMWANTLLLEIGAMQPILGTPFSYRIMYGGLMVGMGLLVVFLLLRFINTLSHGRARVDHDTLNAMDNSE